MVCCSNIFNSTRFQKGFSTHKSDTKPAFTTLNPFSHVSPLPPLPFKMVAPLIKIISNLEITSKDTPSLLTNIVFCEAPPFTEKWLRRFYRVNWKVCVFLVWRHAWLMAHHLLWDQNIRLNKEMTHQMDNSHQQLGKKLTARSNIALLQRMLFLCPIVCLIRVCCTLLKVYILPNCTLTGQ